jgi:membrane protein YqaA with SNARE-associated domain
MTVEQVSVPAERAREFSGRELLQVSLRWGAGLALVFAVMVLVANFFRAPLEGLGRAFVERFGYQGMLLGTFIADGFHFPVPPQFYMLMAITSGASKSLAFAFIACGSLLGGVTGFLLSRRLARFGPIARRVERAGGLVSRAFGRFGYRAALVASLLPVAYSVLCYLAGIYRLPPRVFAVISLCRIPRLVLFFYLVELGWAAR